MYKSAGNTTVAAADRWTKNGMGDSAYVTGASVGRVGAVCVVLAGVVALSACLRPVNNPWLVGLA